jgi:predicted RNA-binding Zn ribbon-like protein
VYTGPLRDEPLAIELHNTLYMADGERVDGLEQADAWLAGLAGRLPDVPGAGPTAAELAALREPVRAALHAAAAGAAQDPAVLAAINRAAARAPHSPAIVPRGDGLAAAVDHHGASRADVVVAALAADAIDLLTGPRGADLRGCHAPGCVLIFLKDHPRREWCCNACGNRARQARHYRRTRGGA